MLLVRFVATNEEALICDFAEYYHILNWRELKPRMAATLAFGLPDESRSKKALSGVQYTTEEMLLATIADRLGLLIWMQTEDGHKNRNKPPMLTEKLMNADRPKNEKAFDSVESFEEARRRILGG